MQLFALPATSSAHLPEFRDARTAREWLDQTARNALQAAQERLASRVGLDTRFAALRAVTIGRGARG